MKMHLLFTLMTGIAASGLQIFFSAGSNAGEYLKIQLAAAG